MPIAIPYILLVESDEDIAAMLQQVIKRELKMDVMFARTAIDVIRVTKAIKPLLFLINERLSDGDGMKLYEYLRYKQELQDVSTIILSTDERKCEQHSEKQSPAYICIPADIDAIIATINTALTSCRKEG